MAKCLPCGRSHNQKHCPNVTMVKRHPSHTMKDPNGCLGVLLVAAGIGLSLMTTVAYLATHTL